MRKNKANGPSAGRIPATDYERLPNDELYRILCAVDCTMTSFPVTDENRQMVIAMLRFADRS